MEDNGAVCPLLWNHFCTHTNGAITPCCRIDMKKARRENAGWDNVNFSKTIWSDQHIETRDLMRQGIKPSICNHCYELEERTGHSARIKYLNEHHEIDYTKEPTAVQTLDIKFNNTCNLACRMCNPGSSSLVASFNKQLDEKDVINDDTYTVKAGISDEEKLSAIKEMISGGQITEFKTTGGEPFYQKAFRDLIDWCCENNYAKNILVKITTNAIQINDDLLKKLLRFKGLHINLSADGTGDVYEYIRYPATWDQYSKNYNRLNQLAAQGLISLSVSNVVSVYNVFNIADYFNYYLKQNRMYDIKQVTTDMHLKPAKSGDLVLDQLPKSLLLEVIDELRDLNKMHDLNKINNCIEYIKNIASNASDTGNIDKLKVLARKSIVYDKQRNQDCRVLDHRLVSLIEQYK